MMDSRERFSRVARGLPVDRMLYLEEELRQEVLERWYREGLSRSVTEDNYRDFFGLDKQEFMWLDLEPKKGKLRSKEDFEQLEEAYRTNPPEFRRAGFWQTKADEYGQRDLPLGVTGWTGFMLPLFTHQREWDSLQDVLLALYDHPDLVKSTLDLIADIYIDAIQLARRYLEFDFGVISEPIASRSGTVISPQMFRDFLLPCYRKVIDFFHDNEMRPVIFWSIGTVNSLIPMAVEAGVDGIWINQVADAVSYTNLRKEYPGLLLIGGLDATVLGQDQDAIRTEVTSKVPPLLATGRYLPALDDNPRENVPYENYLFYRELLREICEIPS